MSSEFFGPARLRRWVVNTGGYRLLAFLDRNNHVASEVGKDALDAKFGTADTIKANIQHKSQEPLAKNLNESS